LSPSFFTDSRKVYAERRCVRGLFTIFLQWPSVALAGSYLTGTQLAAGITTAMSQCVWADKLPENRWPCARPGKIKIERAKCPCGTKEQRPSRAAHRRWIATFHYLNRKHHDRAVRSQPARFTQTRTTAGSQHQLQNDDSRPA